MTHAGMLSRPGLLYRAALEGATLSLYAGLQRMVALGLAPREVRLVGGGSRNRLWAQIVADVFQLPIRWVHVNAGVGGRCLGAAFPSRAASCAAAWQALARGA